MTSHQEVAQIACRELSKIGGVSKLLLFGSVARREEQENSDVDIAVILDKFFSGFPLDLEGFPHEIVERATQVVEGLSRKYGIRIDMCPFWESQYERGIRLCGSKYVGQDLLNETGILMYDFLQ